MSTSMDQFVKSKLFRAMRELFRAAVTKDIAARLEDKALQDRILRSADASIKFIVDDFCSRSGHTTLLPSPMPGPSRAAISLATSLAAAAGTQVHSDTLRAEMMNIAAYLTERAYDPA